MFKVGDIVEPKKDGRDSNRKYLLDYPHDYYIITDVGDYDITILSVNDGFHGMYYYVDGENWQLDTSYLRRKKLEKICSKLEI